MSKPATLKPVMILCGLALFTLPDLVAQQLAFPTPEPKKIPDVDLAKLYHLEWLTRPENQTLKDNVEESALGPWVSKHVLFRSESTPRRSAAFGVGKDSLRAHQRPGLAERDMGSFEPLQDHAERDRNNAIRAGVFRYLFDYRNTGFTAPSQVRFVSVGEIQEDPDPDLIQALQAYQPLTQKKIRVLPASNAISVIDDGIRDRFSGDYGPMYRVNHIRMLENGNAEALASFSNGRELFETSVYELQPVGEAWRVISERPYAVE